MVFGRRLVLLLALNADLLDRQVRGERLLKLLNLVGVLEDKGVELLDRKSVV